MAAAAPLPVPPTHFTVPEYLARYPQQVETELPPPPPPKSDGAVAPTHPSHHSHHSGNHHHRSHHSRHGKYDGHGYVSDTESEDDYDHVRRPSTDSKASRSSFWNRWRNGKRGDGYEPVGTSMVRHQSVDSRHSRSESRGRRRSSQSDYYSRGSSVYSEDEGFYHGKGLVPSNGSHHRSPSRDRSHSRGRSESRGRRDSAASAHSSHALVLKRSLSNVRTTFTDMFVDDNNKRTGNSEMKKWGATLAGAMAGGLAMQQVGRRMEGGEHWARTAVGAVVGGLASRELEKAWYNKKAKKREHAEKMKAGGHDEHDHHHHHSTEHHGIGRDEKGRSQSWGGHF
jgi:hypothetical protein